MHVRSAVDDIVAAYAAYIVDISLLSVRMYLSFDIICPPFDATLAYYAVALLRRRFSHVK